MTLDLLMVPFSLWTTGLTDFYEMSVTSLSMSSMFSLIRTLLGLKIPEMCLVAFMVPLHSNFFTSL